MNQITKHPLQALGYHFIDPQYLPEGADEYYIRNQQNPRRHYRQLTAYEIETLVRNNNTSDNWNHIFVDDAFDPSLVKNCHFYGLIRIGKLEPYYLEFHNLRLAVGLYNSTICSSDLGDNVVINQVNYLSHYIIGNEVIITNVDEMATTDYARFGNGILKQGEPESHRIWLEICNENGGRKVLPFEGMLPGDAYLWSRFRDDEVLMQKFLEFTARQFDHRRGYYGEVGDRTVIKSCKIIKDTRIGSDAYIKGANKIKNITINSSAEAPSQIGEGCELVNGIIGYGCRVFYGVKAVRFVMASHSNLKYGARLINSYLGNNATVSCCEVLNSLIFPAHEQHHNNSFLCAALVMGQSNMAAGATIGSNHNSRGADGEIIAGRGFWPGLCVSLKHNSRFATFTLIAKGNYPAEIDLQIPFSLLVHEESENRLKVMPGYWFRYNMYALARNAWKYQDRDQRTEKIQYLEYDFLAPDSVNEMLHALRLMAYHTGKAVAAHRHAHASFSEAEFIQLGESILQTHDPILQKIEIPYEGLEHSSRNNIFIKIAAGYQSFIDMIHYYGVKNLLPIFEQLEFSSLLDFFQDVSLEPWENVGGQLVPTRYRQQLIQDIHESKINSWSTLHHRYREWADQYLLEKQRHAAAALLALHRLSAEHINRSVLIDWLQRFIHIQQWIDQQIYLSRKKDYDNPFRKMVYDNEQQMEKVLGRLEDNPFLTWSRELSAGYQQHAQRLMQRWEVKVG
ncbi:MAG: DUF4954 family protein [Thermoflavifilum sp.]|nr:DUF4954 family protein [Thermoflavifilum sp.]